MSKPTKDHPEPMASDPKTSSSQAGRILHDSRGNAVWKWDKGSDPSSTASTSKMLRKLDLGSLRLEDAAPEPDGTPDPEKKGSGYGAGYNPYDRTAPVRITPKKPSR
jgi:hypothetical protein